MSVSFLSHQMGRILLSPKKGEKIPKKTYTFDVTKYDEIFDLLVANSQILVPQGAKVSSLEQINKRGLCKYHNFLGIKLHNVFFSGILSKML